MAKEPLVLHVISTQLGLKHFKMLSVVFLVSVTSVIDCFVIVVLMVVVGFR